MTLEEFYRKAVQTGMRNDLRGFDAAAADREKAKKEFSALTEDEKKYFDFERTENPYSDTRILYGDPSQAVDAVMAAIDIDESSILLADRLREKGRRIDAVVGHHPRGHALAQLPDVMEIQAGIHGFLGVPIAQAEGILAPRLKEVASRLQPANHQKTTDAAKLLDVPFLCIHTPCDNCVANHLTQIFDANAPPTLGDVLEMLHEIPEYATARREQTGPEIACGDKKSKTGKIFVDMTGGTEGPKEMYQKFAQSTEISTIVGMHFSKEHLEEAKKNHLNIVLAGHISSDNLGVNLLLDDCLPGNVQIIEAGGFRRVDRRKKAS